MRFSPLFLPFCFYLLAYFDNKLFFRRLSIVRNQLTRKEKWFCHRRPGDSVIFYFFSIFIIFYYDWCWSLESRRARLIFVINTDWHSSLCICVAIYNQKRKKNATALSREQSKKILLSLFSRLHSTHSNCWVRLEQWQRLRYVAVFLARTIGVISKARTQKLLLMFVCLSSPIYIHMYAYALLLLPTPILHSYITEKKKKRQEKEKKIKQKRNGRLDKKQKKALVRTGLLLSFSSVLFLVARFIVALRRVPRPPGASSLLSVSRIIIISSRQQAQQQ